ncbi:hypothetical protein ASPZODRAFT_133878 [Penicilliopsis zonata CBS 506.65]|uniref:Acyltransferase 3 domain-containing protein n=1 Tax=Penicilliopsis zonata CBS 506.65 TaxID=1073090 RepID=A0A1L9SDT8_9EURO|nr:hypothetical protein ASPZODRAFT_133878 [Penicilliopsis zonata CBS 506.65]OJJ45247.1 hypothetical protein ASPZODRAFT_133878 [Penicilliopsis zonata CBS 506.65]
METKYLLGFRGLLAIQAFLWVFLQTFVPAAVYAADNESSGDKQAASLVRKTLSVLFWNEYFLYGALVFLSGRSLAIPFLQQPGRERIARSLITRGIQLWFPVAVSLAIVTVAFSVTSTEYLAVFKARSANPVLEVPYLLPNTFAYFNAVFDLFWQTHKLQTQAANRAFPSATLWLLNAVYLQSFTVYIAMVIVPYTRARWRVHGAILFVITAWWCDSWAWYTISGLSLCDMVINMDWKAHAARGIPVAYNNNNNNNNNNKTSFRIPVYIPCSLLLVAGLLMQYLWAAYRPDLFEREYKYHTNMYYTSGLNDEYTTHHIPARDDVYLVLLGVFGFIESYTVIQRVLENAVLLFLGKRSLSYFLITAPMLYIAGIPLFSHLHFSQHVSFSGSCIATLLVSLLLVAVAGELFYRLVERPTKLLAHAFYDFITA